jgi:hypothetical protein
MLGGSFTWPFSESELQILFGDMRKDVLVALGAFPMVELGAQLDIFNLREELRVEST